MRRVITVSILCLLLPMLSFAQEGSLAELYNRYSGTTGATTVNLTKTMIDLFITMGADSEDRDELLNLTENVKQIKVLNISNKSIISDVSSGFSKATSTSSFTLLSEVNGEGINVKALSYSQSNKDGLAILVVQSSRANIIYIDGAIDFKDLAKLGSTIKIDGLKQLAKSYNK